MKTFITALTLLFFSLQSYAQCPTPLATWASPIGQINATLTWNSVPVATQYWVSIKLANDTVWTIPVSSPNLDTFIYLPHPLMFLPNSIPFMLNPATTYDFAVTAVCAPNVFSPWTYTQFTTLQPCDPPNGLTAGANSSTSAIVNWDYPVNSPIQQFYISYKSTSSSVWELDSTSNNSMTLSGLLPSTNYEVTVQTLCTNGASSSLAYTQFSTSCLPPDPIYLAYDYSPTTIYNPTYPNGIHVSWNAQPNAINYAFSYTQDISYFYPSGGAGTITNTLLNICCVPPLSTYTINVRSNCVGGYNSADTTIQTSPQCWMPTFIVGPYLIGSHTATFNWINIVGAMGYTAQYKKSSDTIWTTAPLTTSTTSRNLTGLSSGTYYNFRVRTNCTSNNSSGWNEENFWTECPSLTGLDVPNANITTTSALATWNAVSGASKYIITYTSTPLTYPYSIDSTTSTSFNLSSLVPNTHYQVWVQAKCGSFVWGPPMQDTFTTKTPLAICNPPIASSIILTTSTTNSLSISWTPVSGAINYTAFYRLKNGSDTTWLPSNTLVGTALNTRFISGLLTGTKYDFKVRTNCGSGYSSVSNYTQTWKATSCPAPTSPSVLSSSITSNSATVNWILVSGASSYKVEYKKNDTSTNWTLHSNAIIGATTNIPNLQHATQYIVRVKTNCNDTSSTSYAQTIPFTTKCPTPTIVSTITSSSQATITWTPIANILNYKIEYKESGGSGFWSGYNSVTTSNPYIVLTNLDNSTNYEARVFTNCNSSLTSNYDTALFYTNCNNIPTGFFVSAKTNVQATINWAGAYGAGGYELQYRVAGSGGGGWQPSINTATNSYTLTGLSSNTSYEYKVRTICSGSGSGSGQSSYSSNQTFTTLAACPVPSGLTAANITSNSAIISWNAIPGVEGYRVEYKDSAVSNWTVFTYSTTDTFADLPNTLMFSKKYDFRIRAKCSSSSSGNYAQSYFTTAPTCNIPNNLNAPANLIGIDNATITWNNNSNVQSYTLQYKLNGQSWSSSSVVTITSINSSPYPLTGLLSCTQYNVRIKAKCLSGDSSDYNSDITFKTKTPGSDFANAIFVGQPPCATDSAWTDTKTNSLANCFDYTYNGPNNQNSRDIWYKFTLDTTATVQISTCASALINTHLHLLTNATTQIAYNNDNGVLCPSSTRASIETTLVAGTYYIVSEGNGSSSGPITTSIRTTNTCNSATGMSVLNLKLFIQGYYNANEEMQPVLMNQGITSASALDADDILVELREVNDPTIIVASDSTTLATDGSASCSFSSLSGNYYIVVKHRNTIETWSKNPVAIGLGTTQYNFHTSASQAYGDNMLELEPGIWGLYTGDIVQDENMDLADLSSVEDDMNSFQYGYFSTDANGDGNVDLVDYQIVEGNISNFIFSIHP